MALKEIWHRFFGIAPGEQAAILHTLSNAGIKTFAFNSNNKSSQTTGILIFDKLTSSIQEFLTEASQQGLHRVIALGASSCNLTKTQAWNLLNAGASDVFTLDHSKTVGSEIAARFMRWQLIDDVVNSPIVKNNLIGQSPVWVRVLRQIVEVAQFTDASILITGESGTGKELVARLIHTLDAKRAKRNLVVLDCTTVSPELSGSEFFGHERGAFTGAIAPREGAFALADGGTLFLDEVGELPVTMQAELLRVVQEHTYKRVGSNMWKQTDFRLICATNRDLLEQEARGEFRRDFYHRIATWTCHLPPLRHRIEDILLLAKEFFAKLHPDKKPSEMDEAVRDYLIQRNYPGNVRELCQLVKRIACHHVGNGPITIGDIPESDRPKFGFEPLDWRDESFERNIKRALLLGVNLKEMTDAAVETAERLAIEEANDNKARAAQRLGINERTLQMHMAARRQNGFATN